MNMIKIVVAAAALAFTFGTAAMAEPATGTTTTTTKVAKTPKVAKVAKPKSPESIECSKQADAKSLHGSARKTFRKRWLVTRIAKLFS